MGTCCSLEGGLCNEDFDFDDPDGSIKREEEEKKRQAALQQQEAARQMLSTAPAKEVQKLDVSALLFKLTIEDKGTSQPPPDRQLQLCFEAMSGLKAQVREKLRQARAQASRGERKQTKQQQQAVLVGADAKGLHELLVRVEGGLSLAVDPVTLAAVHARQSRTDIQDKLQAMGQSESADRETAAFIQAQFSSVQQNVQSPSSHSSGAAAGTRPFAPVPGSIEAGKPGGTVQEHPLSIAIAEARAAREPSRTQTAALGSLPGAVAGLEPARIADAEDDDDIVGGGAGAIGQLVYTSNSSGDEQEDDDDDDEEEDDGDEEEDIDADAAGFKGDGALGQGQTVPKSGRWKRQHQQQLEQDSGTEGGPSVRSGSGNATDPAEEGSVISRPSTDAAASRSTLEKPSRADMSKTSSMSSGRRPKKKKKKHTKSKSIRRSRRQSQAAEDMDRLVRAASFINIAMARDPTSPSVGGGGGARGHGAGAAIGGIGGSMWTTIGGPRNSPLGGASARTAARSASAKFMRGAVGIGAPRYPDGVRNGDGDGEGGGRSAGSSSSRGPSLSQGPMINSARAPGSRSDSPPMTHKLRPRSSVGAVEGPSGVGVPGAAQTPSSLAVRHLLAVARTSHLAMVNEEDEGGNASGREEEEEEEKEERGAKQGARQTSRLVTDRHADSGGSTGASAPLFKHTSSQAEQDEDLDDDEQDDTPQMQLGGSAVADAPAPAPASDPVFKASSSQDDGSIQKRKSLDLALSGRTRSKSADKDDVSLDAGLKPVQLTRRGSKTSMALGGYGGLLQDLPSRVSSKGRKRAGKILQLIGSYDFDPVGLDRWTKGHAVAIVAPIVLRAAGYLRAGSSQPDPMLCVRVEGIGSGSSSGEGTARSKQNLLAPSDAREALARFPQMDGSKMSSFLQAVLKGYRRASNPFHNDVHAVDVMHTVFVMLQSPLLFEVFSAEQGLAMVLGALLHDLGHPGLTNNFLVATAHPLALRYNDQSVLENMHIAEAFRLMAVPENNVLGTVGRGEYQSTRRSMIECVLATDMAGHFGMMEAFETEVVAAAESALRNAIRVGTSRTGRAVASIHPGLKRRGTDLALLAKTQLGGKGPMGSSTRVMPGTGGVPIARGGSFVNLQHTRQSAQEAGPQHAASGSLAAPGQRPHPRMSMASTSVRSFATSTTIGMGPRSFSSFASVQSSATAQLAIAGRRQWYGADEKAVAAALQSHARHLCKALVHAADISNPTKPRDIALAWARRCMDEFYEQGDIERERGMAISPNFDRTSTHEARCQLGFISFIIEPTFKSIRKVLPHVSEDLQFSLEGNKIMYESRAAAGHSTLPRFGQATRRKNSTDSSMGSQPSYQPQVQGRDDRDGREKARSRRSPSPGAAGRVRSRALTGGYSSMDDAVAFVAEQRRRSSSGGSSPEAGGGAAAQRNGPASPIAAPTQLEDLGRKGVGRTRADSPKLRPLSAKASLAGSGSGSGSASGSPRRAQDRPALELGGLPDLALPGAVGAAPQRDAPAEGPAAMARKDSKSSKDTDAQPILDGESVHSFNDGDVMAFGNTMSSPVRAGAAGTSSRLSPT